MNINFKAYFVLVSLSKSLLLVHRTCNPNNFYSIYYNNNNNNNNIIIIIIIIIVIIIIIIIITIIIIIVFVGTLKTLTFILVTVQ